MRPSEGLPFVKLMMLLNSMAPLFVLVGIRGIGQILSDQILWTSVAALAIIPYLVLRWRIFLSKRSNDTYMLNVTVWRTNKEYLFTYFFTVLLPLYGVSITSVREFVAVLFAICFVLFVLWNLNLHFVNVFFAFQGYKVITLVNENGAILLTQRHHIPASITELRAHRISNSVFIELKDFPYDPT
jgi:hypothetical protein